MKSRFYGKSLDLEILLCLVVPGWGVLPYTPFFGGKQLR